MGNTTRGAAHGTMPEVGQRTSLSENAEIQSNNRQEGGREGEASAVQPMRQITHIIVHCSATPEGRDVSAADIDRYHRSRGFACIGYHCVCYVGGVDAAGHSKDTRTPAQRWALLHLLSELRRRYPKARIYGHRDFAPKACPCFDATKEYAGL